MATSRTYANIRLLSHALILIIIVSNLFLLGFMIYNYSFFRVESSLVLGLFDMQTSYKYTIITNIIMGLFGSCAINSKVKYYMQMYIIFGFFGLSTLIAFFMFVYLAYFQILMQQYSMQMGQNASTRFIVHGMLNCTDSGVNNCEKVTRDIVKSLIFVYVTVSGCSFVATFIVYILARVALMVDPNAPKPRIPKMERNRQVGFESASLRNKRFIDRGVDSRIAEFGNVA